MDSEQLKMLARCHCKDGAASTDLEFMFAGTADGLGYRDLAVGLPGIARHEDTCISSRNNAADEGLPAVPKNMRRGVDLEFASTD